MAYSSPATVVTGTTGTSVWGNSVKAALDYLANRPTVRVRKSNQNITTGTDTLLTWDLEDFDPLGMHSTSSNTSRLVVPDAGVYLFTLQPDWDGNATGQRSCSIGKNMAGTPPGLGANRLASATAHTRADVEVSLSGIVKLAANDYLEAFVYQDSGGTRVFGGAQRVVASFTLTWQCLG